MSSIVTFSEFFDYILHMNYVYLANAKDRKKTQVLKPFSVSIFPPLRKFDCLTQEVISNFPDESCLF